MGDVISHQVGRLAASCPDWSLRPDHFEDHLAAPCPAPYHPLSDLLDHLSDVWHFWFGFACSRALVTSLAIILISLDLVRRQASLWTG